jgi:hypothetical protein
MGSPLPIVPPPQDPAIPLAAFGPGPQPAVGRLQLDLDLLPEPPIEVVEAFLISPLSVRREEGGELLLRKGRGRGFAVQALEVALDVPLEVLGQGAVAEPVEVPAGGE